MNKQRMLQLADFIENLKDEQFSMIYFGGNCDTAHCIGGWANVLFTGKVNDPRWREEDLPGQGSEAARKAQQLLGLTDEQADQLFFDWPDFKSDDKHDAARRIRQMAETGRWTQPKLKPLT